MSKKLLLIIALCVSMIALLEPVPKAWGQTIRGISVNRTWPPVVKLLQPSATKIACSSCHFSSKVDATTTVSPAGLLLAKKKEVVELMTPYDIKVISVLKQLGNVSKVGKVEELTLREAACEYQCMNSGGNAFTINNNSALLPEEIVQRIEIDPDWVSKNGNATLETMFYYYDQSETVQGYQDICNAYLPAEGEFGCAGKDNWVRVGEDVELIDFKLIAVLESWFCTAGCDTEEPTYVVETNHELGMQCVEDGAVLDCWKICDSLDADFPSCSAIIPES